MKNSGQTPAWWPATVPVVVIKNIRLFGRRTSVRLEQLELQALDRICAAEGISVDEFCQRADHDPDRTERSRTSRIRMAILAYYKAKAEGRTGGLPSGPGGAKV